MCNDARLCPEAAEAVRTEVRGYIKSWGSWIGVTSILAIIGAIFGFYTTVRESAREAAKESAKEAWSNTSKSLTDELIKEQIGILQKNAEIKQRSGDTQSDLDKLRLRMNLAKTNFEFVFSEPVAQKLAGLKNILENHKFDELVSLLPKVFSIKNDNFEFIYPTNPASRPIQVSGTIAKIPARDKCTLIIMAQGSLTGPKFKAVQSTIPPGISVSDDFAYLTFAVDGEISRLSTIDPPYIGGTFHLPPTHEYNGYSLVQAVDLEGKIDGDYEISIGMTVGDYSAVASKQWTLKGVRGKIIVIPGGSSSALPLPKKAP